MNPSHDHLLLDSAPNIGPLISHWELDKFRNCWNKSFRTSKILTHLYQQCLNLVISQRDMSGPCEISFNVFMINKNVAKVVLKVHLVCPERCWSSAWVATKPGSRRSSRWRGRRSTSVLLWARTIPNRRCFGDTLQAVLWQSRRTACARLSSCASHLLSCPS